jgi:NAD(P)H-hydrate epimerase
MSETPLLKIMYLSREQVREIDRRAAEEYGMPGVVLMENAGRGAAEWLLTLGSLGSAVICCGKGNNGGDGFVIARYLDLHHVPVQVILFAEPENLTGDAATNCTIVRKSGITFEAVAPAFCDNSWLTKRLSASNWIVDALFGTGLAGALRAPWDGIIECINASRHNVLAVDIPSGLDCDTGKTLGCAVRATHTATFVARKKGFANPLSRAWTGVVETVPIGVPRALLEELCSTETEVAE